VIRAAALALAALAVACSEPFERQNLVLISLDTCRPDRLSLYGARRPNSPNLDRFAERAIVFRDCMAQSALTAPSHLSMLTGHYVHRHGLWNNQGSAEPPYTMASLLREAGWRTAAFTGHGSFQAKHGLDYGFDTFRSETEGVEDTVTRNLDETVPEAIAWLDGVGEEPFFLLVHGYDPHCPFAPPPPYDEEYGGWYAGELDLSDTCHPHTFRELIEDGTIARDEVRWINDLYDGEVAAADVHLGTLFDALEERGRFEDTIVVFTSDHGEVLGNHGWIGHGQVWEEALRVPLVVRFPEEGLRGDVSSPVQHVDLVPTLLSALGLPAVEGVQGIDLMPLVRREESDLVPEDRMRLASCGDPSVNSVRFGNRYKVVFGISEDGQPIVRGLHDLAKDPLERENLVATPKGREESTLIMRRYLAWRDATADADRLWRGRIGSSVQSAEDLETLKALGYVGEDESVGESE